MVEQPERQIDAFAAAGANCITIHLESTRHPHRVLQQIHDRGCEAGITLNPGTPVAALEPMLADCDRVQIMSVNPAGAVRASSRRPSIASARPASGSTPPVAATRSSPSTAASTSGRSPRSSPPARPGWSPAPRSTTTARRSKPPSPACAAQSRPANHERSEERSSRSACGDAASDPLSPREEGERCHGVTEGGSPRCHRRAAPEPPLTSASPCAKRRRGGPDLLRALLKRLLIDPVGLVDLGRRAAQR